MAREVAVLLRDGMVPPAALLLVDVGHGVRGLHRWAVRCPFAAVVIVRGLSGAGRGRCDGNGFVVPAMENWETICCVDSFAVFGNLGSVGNLTSADEPPCAVGARQLLPWVSILIAVCVFG